MIDLSITLNIERIDNGYLAIGTIGDQDVRMFYAYIDDFMNKVSTELTEQVKQARQHEGKYDFTLKIEAHCEDGHD